MCDIEENETQNNDSVSRNKDKSKNESPATMIKEKSEDEILEVKSSSDCNGVTRDQFDAPDKTVATELKRLPRSQKKRLKQELAMQRKKRDEERKKTVTKAENERKGKEREKGSYGSTY